MERLTDKKEADAQRREYEIRLKQGYPRNIPEERFLRLAAYEDTGLEPGEIEQLKGEVLGLRLDKQELEQYRALGPIDRLRELAQADKLIGKTVYYPYAEKILEKRMSHFIIYDERRANLPPKESWFCINDDKSETFGFEDIGKTVFLTREEAESALRREQDG
jgi:hypothetical protein